MNKIAVKFCIPFIGAAVFLSACGNQSGTNDNQAKTQSASNAPGVADHYGTGQAKHINDPDVIPNYYGPKTNTTNELGTTTRGMGMSVYSMMGSSSLHEGGISSHVESRLRGQGIDGVKAFVLDDTVVLAREEHQFTSNQYDDLQNKVLNPHAGMSGKSTPERGTWGSQGATDDNLEKAKEQVNAMFDGHVEILTVTDPQAFDTIERIKTKLHSSSLADKTLSDDISTLMRMATKK